MTPREGRLLRMEARAAADQDRALAAMSDAELEALVLSGRPDTAGQFRERGDPMGWPEAATWTPAVREIIAEFYQEWQSGAWGDV